jgi:ABC-type glutathione transport system ATPase component
MLKVSGLTVTFGGGNTPLRDFDLAVGQGEIVGLCGPSGCGKSVFASSLLGMIEPPGRVMDGSAAYTLADGRAVDLYKLPEPSLSAVRGREIGVVFQDPVAALHPARRVASQFWETLKAHGVKPRARGIELAEEMLGQMSFASPKKVMASYPFDLSGGMCQRVCLAMALALRPRLLLADEPTTALDGKTQGQILRLLQEARERDGTAILLISHDMDMLRSVSDRIVSMPQHLG